MAEIVLVRHGQTEWSAAGRHTSRTDLDLTPDGEEQAGMLMPVLGRWHFTAVLCSPRRRALRTAELAGLTVTEVVDSLTEWDYGDYEGLTTAQIRRTRRDWDLWRDGCPGGESPAQVGTRVDRVLDRAHALLADGDIAIVGHGHALRVTGARWAGWPVADGARLALSTATLSVLGFEHDRPVLTRWNAGVS
jgi:probable phosphoglycerate mutase